jgi:hypothetical protein
MALILSGTLIMVVYLEKTTNISHPFILGNMLILQAVGLRRHLENLSSFQGVLQVGLRPLVVMKEPPGLMEIQRVMLAVTEGLQGTTATPGIVVAQASGTILAAANETGWGLMAWRMAQSVRKTPAGAASTTSKKADGSPMKARPPPLTKTT